MTLLHLQRPPFFYDDKDFLLLLGVLSTITCCLCCCCCSFAICTRSSGLSNSPDFFLDSLSFLLPEISTDGHAADIVSPNSLSKSLKYFSSSMYMKFLPSA